MAKIQELLNNNPTLSVLDCDGGKIVIKEVVDKGDKRIVNYYITKDVDVSIDVGDIVKVHHNLILGDKGLVHSTRNVVNEYIKVDDVSFYVDVKLKDYIENIKKDVKFGTIPDEVALYLSKMPQFNKCETMIDVNTVCEALSPASFIIAVININKGLCDRYLTNDAPTINTEAPGQHVVTAVEQIKEEESADENEQAEAAQVDEVPNVPPINLANV